MALKYCIIIIYFINNQIVVLEEKIHIIIHYMFGAFNYLSSTNFQPSHNFLSY